ncbi:MAG TPA: transglutaminase-like domain-containing protein [Myxococcota bacterium]|nr:transglutaminase-like domain-containing protein [Myxococcota bacterium]
MRKHRPKLNLLLAFAVFFSSACSKKDKQAPPPNHEIIAAFEQFPEDAGKLQSERWFSISLQGKPAGSYHLTIRRCDTPRGIRRLVHGQTHINLQMGETRSEISFDELSLVNEKWQLLRMRMVEGGGGGEDVTIRAGKVGSEMVTVRGPEVKRVPFDKSALRRESYAFLFKGKQPEPGDVKSYREFSADTADYVDNRLEVKSISEDGRLNVEQTTSAMPGSLKRIKLDSHYLPVEIDAWMGSLVVRFELRDGKPNPENRDGPDLNVLTSIPLQLPWKDPAAITHARYRIAGLPKQVEASWMTGPGQTVVANSEPGTFVIEVAKMSAPPGRAFPLKIDDNMLRHYLASTSYSRTDDSSIRQAAKEALGGETDAWAAARRMRAFVSHEISPSRSMAFASASDTLREKKGDCTEQSVLLATLARSAGIPARCVMGLVYQDGAFNRHMWTEVWVGRWQPIDAAMQTDYPSAAWIRLGENSLQFTADKRTGMGGLLAFASKLSIKVESFETAKKATPQ